MLITGALVAFAAAPGSTVETLLTTMLESANPARLAVTATERSSARSFTVGVYDAAVAPTIGTPFTRHWYRYEVGVRSHVPGVTVSLTPTCDTAGRVGAVFDCSG